MVQDYRYLNEWTVKNNYSLPFISDIEEMANKREFSVKRKKCVYTKGWNIEIKNNPITLWYTSSRIWMKMKDDRASDKELLVARNDKRYRTICRRVWYVSEDEK